MKLFLFFLFSIPLLVSPVSAEIKATASSEEKPEVPASNVVDGDINTRWASTFSDNQWIEIDMGTIKSIEQIDIFWESAFAKKYEVLIAEKKPKWKSVYSTSDGDGKIDNIRFQKQPAQFIKINCISRATEWGNSIYEVTIKGVHSLRTYLPNVDQHQSFFLVKEDPLVLEWLKQCQDRFTPNKDLMPSCEDSQISTFNNALVAMAFILKGEKERAERILDFFAKATKKDNQIQELQNFFYKGEARGFYQYAVYGKRGNVSGYFCGASDRWMGDMGWLLIAYKYYEKTYNSKKYEPIVTLMKNLLVSWFKDGGDWGYVQHGWRGGDRKLHEPFGHHEGNIDAYIALKLCGETVRAGKIRKWLEKEIQGNNLPLDLYTWRALAFGKEILPVLNIPEYDTRYRKMLSFNGSNVAGFFHGADENAKNIWIDGVGHMSCAYIACEEPEKAYFYSNQLDALLINRTINGVKTRSIPYTINKSGGYEWVDTNRGFNSASAWYIFAKNLFNPFTFTKLDVKPPLLSHPYQPIAGAVLEDPKAVPSDLFSQFQNWETEIDNGASLEFSTLNNREALLNYSFDKGGWVLAKTNASFSQIPAVAFELKTEGPANNLEIKFIDSDGSIFGYKIKDADSKEYKRVTIKPSEFSYWWGGDKNLNGIDKFHFALSKSKGGKGKIFIRNLTFQ